MGMGMEPPIRTAGRNLRITTREMMFRHRVKPSSTRPRPKADRVSGLSKDWSPVRASTMRTLTVVMPSSGFQDRLGCNPAAMTTIMVSPTVRDMASRQAEIMPGRAAGRTTRVMVS